MSKFYVGIICPIRHTRSRCGPTGLGTDLSDQLEAAVQKGTSTDLGPMYVTDRRQTVVRRASSLNAPTLGVGT